MTSKPFGPPDSPTVGTSGKAATRLGAATARKRSLPARCSGPAVALLPSAKASSPVDDRGVELRGLLVDHVLHLRAGGRLEQLRAQVHRVADRPRAVVELARVGLGVGDQVAHGLVLAVGRHGEEEVGLEQRQQRVEVLGRVVGQLLEQRRIGREVHVVEHDQVVPVLGAALEGVDRDEAVAAGPVLDHHRLAPGARELVGHQARHAVRAAAHRERRDDAHRLGRELLRAAAPARSAGRPAGRRPDQCERDVVGIEARRDMR